MNVVVADLAIMAQLVRTLYQESALNQETNGNINKLLDHDDIELAK